MFRSSVVRYLIKVGDDLVEEADTLQSVSVLHALTVELFELRHRGEHHAHAVTRTAVQVLDRTQQGMSRTTQQGMSRTTERILFRHFVTGTVLIINMV